MKIYISWHNQFPRTVRQLVVKVNIIGVGGKQIITLVKTINPFLLFHVLTRCCQKYTWKIRFLFISRICFNTVREVNKGFDLNPTGASRLAKNLLNCIKCFWNTKGCPSIINDNNIEPEHPSVLGSPIPTSLNNS